MLCLSDFELYSRWVPLKQPRVGTSENVSSWLLARFRRRTVFMNQTEYIKFIVLEKFRASESVYLEGTAGSFDFGASLERLWFRRRAL